MKIVITSGVYGSGHNWALVIKNKRFYLGQDVKFCTRVLGMQPSDVMSRIGTRDIGDGEVGNKRLAKFILSELKITKKQLKTLEPWGICAQ